MAEASPRTQIGALLVKHRLQAEMTQELLAERAGMGVRSIQAIERGESRPRRETVRQLAKALGLDEAQSAELVELAQPAPRARRHIWTDETSRGKGFDGRAEVPRAVSQLQPQEREPLSEERPSACPSAPPHNLQPSLTSFVGREREVVEVRRLLGMTRLLTLTGAGGCGKTRLALEVASSLLPDYPDGVWLVELAPLANADLVPQAVAAALGLREVPSQPTLATLLSSLRAKRLLLLLDNCEHLVEACARTVGAILRGCPAVKVLATSRAALQVSGEHECPVPPLALPDPANLPSVEDLGLVDAIRLFVGRAQAVQPAFALTPGNASSVAAICRRLDGLPLAIELAAARIRILPPQSLLARMGRRLPLLSGGAADAPRRHQTMRWAIEWSYNLLPPPQAALFERLSVFVGGCALEAAEAICDGEAGPQANVLLGIEALAAKSLLQHESTTSEPRLWLLETVREYALERLEASGKAEELRQRHTAYYLGVAEEAEWRAAEAEGARSGYQSPEWLGQLASEEGNLRAASDWAIQSGRAELALRLGASLWRYWYFRGQFTEGRQRLAAALSLSGPLGDRLYLLARLSALEAAARLAQFHHDHVGARGLLVDAVAVARSLDEPTRAVGDLQSLGMAAYYDGDSATAVVCLDESCSLARSLGLGGHIATALMLRGIVAHYSGDLPRARALLEESVELQRAPGHRPNDDSLGSLGYLLLDQGYTGAARAVFVELLAYQQIEEFRRGIGTAKRLLSAVSLAEGDWITARTLLEEGLLYWQGTGEWGGWAAVIASCSEWAAAVGHRERASWLAWAAAVLWRTGRTPAPHSIRARLAGLLRQLERDPGTQIGTDREGWGQSSLSEAIAYALDTLRRDLSGSERLPVVGSYIAAGDRAT